MLNSEVVTVSIDRPYADVYDFCIDPMNFGRWNLMPDGIMEPLGGHEYLVDLPQGRKVMRFMQPNSFGILDYQVYERGESAGQVRPIRLVRNEAGTDLQLTWFQQPGVSEERFRSEIEWLRSDLLRLKTFLETGTSD
jgi:hypothetical protein